MPYCMSSRNSWIIDGRDLGIFKKEISKDILYNRAIEYWRTYIEEKELKEDDLSTFDSVVLAEKLCGNLSQDDVENLLRKLLKIEIDQNQPIERTIYSLKKKVSVIKSLQDPDCFSRFSEFESLKHSICNKMPSIDEIEKLNDVCVTYNYYVVKNFCSRDAVVNSIRDYLLITKYLEERYSDSEEILCQMAIYQLSEK